MSAGADVVIHSVHKTLPAMTQTALLHVQGEIANRERIRKFLSIYQSSSPSYVLMASIDACVDLIERDGEELFAKHVRELKNFRESCRELKWLYLAGLDSEKDGIWQLEAKLAEFGQTADFDRSKLLFFFLFCQRTSFDIADFFGYTFFSVLEILMILKFLSRLKAFCLIFCSKF